MMKILAELVKEAEREEVAKVINLALGQLKPKFDRLEFNLAEKMVVKAIARVKNESVEEVVRQYKERGDLGEVAAGAGGEGKLTVSEVYQELVAIAKEGGAGSQERKIARLVDLLTQECSLGRKYVVRVVLGKLRLGFSDKTVLDALSYMEYESKEGRAKLDYAYQVFPDVGKIAKEVKEGGVERLREKVGVTLGTPVLPALAQRLKTADEMIAKMGRVVVEPKFDGTRVELHFRQAGWEEGGRQVRTFTRNLDENSGMFPELARAGEQIAAREVILDSEAVGYDPRTGKQVPFQLTITRKRKHGVGAASGEVPLKFNVFDILYRDGESLLERSLEERRKILKEVVGGVGPLVVDEELVTEKPEEIRRFHARMLKEGLEGAMVKKAEGKYLPGRQDWNWVKFKESEDSRAKLADTLDVVVMGYYRGRGKRVQFGLGALLVGVRDEEKLVTIAKIGTGLTDEQFRQVYTKLQSLVTETMDKRYVVSKSLVPDVWVEPALVVEVAADEVTRSPSHSSGLALRFPRMVRIREDKDLSGVTSVQEVREISVN